MKKIVRTLFVCATALLAVSCSNEPKVKNIIFLIGDGMGLAQVSGVSLINNWEPLALERAEYIGLQKSYSANNRVTDSAASGTALATGHKTYNSAIGVDVDKNPVPSTRELAQAAGYATGVVATYSVTNATPASFVAHEETRYAEDNIALDYLEADIDLFIGGGTRFFMERRDGRNLAEELKAKGFTVATDMAELDGITEGKVAALLAPNAMPTIGQGRSKDYLPGATAKALEILSNNSKKGFFVMIEGSQIDGGGHDNNMVKIYEETVDFDNAVKVAFDFADTHPGTLVVVTADHETGGLSLVSGKTDFTLPEQGVKYEFGTTGHSAIWLPVYAYGEGAEEFSGVMENTDIAKKMQKLLGLVEE